MRESSEFVSQLREAVASGEEQSMEALAYQVGTMVLEEGTFPEECFDAILAVLPDTGFLKMNGAWKLLRVFEENWDELSEHQRADLLPALERNYDSFGDWMACFVISGILGELYRDTRALASLRRLKNSKNENARSFVPHGFEHIALEAQQQDLAKHAYQELVAMATDGSAKVRTEVKKSLSRIEKKGIGRVGEGNKD